ncbi:MAG: PIN domain nuclease [Planctomycetales bacterium]|nr:PIN domain nuclease [Planctomycetales bacterium]
MPTLIDTSLWIDFTRARSPAILKKFIAPYILHPDAHLTEPIILEVLRHATPQESRQLTRQFQTLPLLAVPANLWSTAATLGQHCRQKGIAVQSVDLLIAIIAEHHGATLITLDDDFQKIAAVSKLQVKVLQRPVP